MELPLSGIRVDSKSSELSPVAIHWINQTSWFQNDISGAENTIVLNSTADRSTESGACLNINSPASHGEFKTDVLIYVYAYI